MIPSGFTKCGRYSDGNIGAVEERVMVDAGLRDVELPCWEHGPCQADDNGSCSQGCC